MWLDLLNKFVQCRKPNLWVILLLIPLVNFESNLLSFLLQCTPPLDFFSSFFSHASTITIRPKTSKTIQNHSPQEVITIFISPPLLVYLLTKKNVEVPSLCRYPTICERDRDIFCHFLSTTWYPYIGHGNFQGPLLIHMGHVILSMCFMVNWRCSI